MTTTNTNDYVETPDMALAALLQNKGYKLSHIKPVYDMRCLYCFKETEGIYEAIRAYESGELLVEPKYFWYLITTLHSNYHGEGNYED